MEHAQRANTRHPLPREGGRGEGRPLSTHGGKRGDGIRAIDLPARQAGLFLFRPLRGLNVAAAEPELPHRHNFQELIWIRAGRGRHAIDGTPLDLLPGTCYFIARGQVHQFLESKNVHGCVLRFADELIPEARGAEDPAYPLAWFNSAGAARGVRFAAAEAREFDRLFALMASECARPPQAGRLELLGALLRAVLVKLGRALQLSRIETAGAGGPQAELFRAFILLLERDYAAHHDVAHYAAALGASQRRLAEAVRLCAGVPPKQLVEERLLLEAKRLLQFTRRSTKEIAYALGFQDPPYFSKVFRRGARCSPLDYRRSQGLPQE